MQTIADNNEIKYGFTKKLSRMNQIYNKSNFHQFFWSKDLDIVRKEKRKQAFHSNFMDIPEMDIDTQYADVSTLWHSKSGMDDMIWHIAFASK